MANLYMMMGLPGSGKTTFAHTYFKSQSDPPPVYISRDEIRFGILEKYNIDTEDEYFAHEVEVYEKFCNQIILYLKKGYDVIADATHLYNASRWKLINRVSDYYDKWIIIFLNPDVRECIENNRKRTGLARVPENVIYHMNRNMEYPSLNKDMLGRGINEIWTVTPKSKKWCIDVHTYKEILNE